MNTTRNIAAGLAVRFSVSLMALGLTQGYVKGAETFSVVPAEYANITAPGNPEIGEAINGYNSLSGQTLQYVIPGAYLTPLADQYLTGLSFRLNNVYAPDLPAISYANFSIQLSPFSEASLSPVFGENLVNPVTVLNRAFIFDAGAFPTGATGTTPNAFGNFMTFDQSYLYTGGSLLVTIRHSQPQGPDPEGDYWSVDAYQSGFYAAIGHDTEAETADTLWPFSPITEFTTAPLTPNGIVVPEPNPLAFLVLGLVSFLAFFRRKL